MVEEILLLENNVGLYLLSKPGDINRVAESIK
jgi:hypothetical protein